MASLASRSEGLGKFDGLLVAAVELCEIVRASYLSPSFPLLLFFGFWQYLRAAAAKLRSFRSGNAQLSTTRDGELG